jgi:hypothetical protein
MITFTCLSVSHLAQKWRTLRRKYVTETKAVPKSGSGAAEIKPFSATTTQMSFLDATINCYEDQMDSSICQEVSEKLTKFIAS